MDRYTPGEAYAFTTYQLKKNKQNKYLPPVESKPVSQTQPPRMLLQIVCQASAVS